MTQSSIRRTLLATVFMIAAPTILVAQQAPQAAPRSADDIEAIFAEFQAVHMQLEDVQLRALRDPQLSAAQEALGEEIRVAMETHDPTMKQRMDRISTLETEAQAAQQSGDMPRLQELIAEAEQIEGHFMSVQQHVIQQPAIATKITAFQTQLERKMIEIDPQVERLIARFHELETVLAAAIGGGA